MSDPARLRQRFDVPLKRVRRIGERAVESFPMRVWHQFSLNNGFLLSAGMGYYVLFGLFAVLYVAFAGVGFWLGGSTDAASRAIHALIDVVNTYIPDLIGDKDDDRSLVSTDEVVEVAQSISNMLWITGAVAIVVGAWTATSAVTFTRRAVRDIFGLPFDDRSYLVLKLRDLFAGITFGGTLLIGALLATVGTWALTQLFDLLGWSTSSLSFAIGVRASSVLVALLVNAAALASLVHFLTGTSIPWRAIWPGSLIGGTAMVVLQLALGLLISRGPSNPLLATFTVLVGVLLWCRFMSIVVLGAAAWIAVTAEDRDHPLIEMDENAVRLAEREALVLAARVHLRQARQRLEEAPWYRRAAAKRDVRAASEELSSAGTELEKEQQRQASAARARWRGLE